MKKLTLLFTLLLLFAFPVQAARNFDGTNDKIAFSDVSSVGNYTVSIWWNHDSGQSGAGAIFAWDNFPTDPRVACVIKAENGTGDSSFEAHVDGTGAVVDITLLSDNVWHHTAVVRSGTTVTPYVDGVAQSTITVGSGTFTAENIRIGDHFFSGGDNEFYDGHVANFVFYKFALTASEIAALANCAPPNRIGGAKHIYAPIWGASTPEADLSGNANNGTVTEAVLSNHVCGPHR